MLDIYLCNLAIDDIVHYLELIYLSTKTASGSHVIIVSLRTSSSPHTHTYIHYRAHKLMGRLCEAMGDVEKATVHYKR